MRIALTAALAAASALPAQSPGLRLFCPLQGNASLIVDGNGTIVKSLPGTGSIVAHMTANGDVIRGMTVPNNGFPGTTGRLQRISINGDVKWDMVVSNTRRIMHHDICELPNGNMLVMAVDRMTSQEAIAEGRDATTLLSPGWLPAGILEIQQTGPATGEVVWEWHVMDHIIQDLDPAKPNYGVVSDHPELVDINYPPVVLSIAGDWNHANGIDYDPVNDWIIFSSRDQDECWLIDHSTTTAEAAGHTGGARGRGGDLLWRWGNPECYGRGGPADRQLFRQHDPRFIPPGYPGAGNITIFNNQATPTQSTVIEITLPVDGNGDPFLDPATNVYGPAAPVWTYQRPGFYSSFVSGAQRLRNGNTLICSGAESMLFEVNPNNETVWSYTDPAGSFIFQCEMVDRRLWTTQDELSVQNGGTVGVTHMHDTERSGDTYILLGSLAGTAPGSMLPGGLMLPLNTDALLIGMLTQPNTPLFVDTLGTIDATGNAQSSIYIPAGLLLPALIGLEMSLSHVVIDSSGFAVEVSNVETVSIVP